MNVMQFETFSLKSDRGQQASRVLHLFENYIVVFTSPATSLSNDIHGVIVVDHHISEIRYCSFECGTSRVLKI